MGWECFCVVGFDLGPLLPRWNEDIVFAVFYSTFPDNYAFLSLSPSPIKNTQSADTVPIHGHSPLVF